MTLVVLHKNLSKKKELEDAMFKGHLEIDACHTNLNLIFLSLFML